MERTDKMKYICSYCNTYVYNEKEGDPQTKLVPGTVLEEIPDSWLCPVCGMPKEYLKPVSNEIFDIKYKSYTESKHKAKDINYYRLIARNMLHGICGEYEVCNGKPERMCAGQNFGSSIGFGGAGQGKTFEENYNSLQRYKLKMRVIKDHKEPEMSLKIFNKQIALPVMGSSLSGVKNSMNDSIPEETFYRGLLHGAMSSGTISLVGNTNEVPDDLGVKTVGENHGWGIPIFKPQSQERLLELIKQAEKLNVLAAGVDLEGAGSTFWKAGNKPLYRKGEKDLLELVDSTELPIIFKGVMCRDDAIKVLDVGAAACYVSNHGGRVLDGAQGVSDVLPEISNEINGKIPILADGAVRTGFDVLKILALGADVALIGRPLARLSLAGGEAAVKLYYKYVKDDLRNAMLLTGCDNLNEVGLHVLTGPSLEQYKK